MKNFPPKTPLFVHSRVSAQLSANLVQIFGTSAGLCGQQDSLINDCESLDTVPAQTFWPRPCSPSHTLAAKAWIWWCFSANPPSTVGKGLLHRLAVARPLVPAWWHPGFGSQRHSSFFKPAAAIKRWLVTLSLVIAGRWSKYSGWALENKSYKGWAILDQFCRSFYLSKKALANNNRVRVQASKRELARHGPKVGPN
jgi:hypothetical protein